MSPKITPLTALSVSGGDFDGLGQSTAMAHLSLVGRSAVSGKPDKPGLWLSVREKGPSCHLFLFLGGGNDKLADS